MSGGSYDYLYLKEADDLITATRDIDSMATKLIELGYEDATKETLNLKHVIEQSAVRIEVIKERLEDICHAVEWYESNDYGLEEVEEAVKKYRGEI